MTAGDVKLTDRQKKIAAERLYEAYLKTVDGRLVVVSGATRSGKTAYVRGQVRKDRRVIAWDPEDQWSRLPGWKRVTSRKELLALAQRPGPVRAGFVVGGKLQDEFDFWAACMMYAGRYVAPIVAIAEELADVTTPSKAPGAWGILLRRGLKRGITIYAISQRWSEADKTAVGNASEFVLFRQSSGDDVRYLSRKTRVPESELAGLMQLQYVRLSAIDGAISRGKLTF
ncbi:hypothetical protein SAMN05216428_102447 [Nitrosospira sp. Nsp11]|uniref:hypothetical protein n=1 Tax=Nitrosospira sp. Nsp11 TaxID=1855338 RepID=UPI000923F914|nr:hypothetical protein [Nitrosospira sp. Nsp11]SHL45211.1 hypothetical protein SAMN05216428_102447 [Nitrosospira sp. Nsp11]